MKLRTFLPLAAAATLGLSACAKHDDAANNSAAATDETLTLNDEGAADNSYDAIGAGNVEAPAADNALAPVDAPTGNAAAGNAL